MAIVSCSNGAMGFFNSYGNIAERTDIDVVVHLGDYIYEYAGTFLLLGAIFLSFLVVFAYLRVLASEDGEFGHGAPIGRTPEPNVNLKTLSDYRKRHAQVNIIDSVKLLLLFPIETCKNQYKRDPDLQAIHAAHPFIVIW